VRTGSDSDSGGGDDANGEYEDTGLQGVINEDSDEEVARDVALDKDSDDDKLEELSLFDEEGELKKGKDDLIEGKDKLPKID
jgi:hypothetical protein